MALLSLALYVFAVLLVAGALWAVRSGQRAALRERVDNRFQDISALRTDAGTGSRPMRGSAFRRWLWRGGIRITPSRVAAGAAGLAAGLALAWRYGGSLAAVAVLGLAVTALVVWPHYLYRKRAATMVAQIPLFLDQVVRGLATGRNLDGAMRLASEETREPLGEAMARVRQAVDLGQDIGDALRDAAGLYDLKELYFIAMAVQIAHSFGSSPKEMLESAAQLVRQREQGQRELRALTGETRISAWVLSLLPSALALYMVAVNPDYINSMWQDPSGRNILLVSLGLQATGAFILWRMVKSV